LVNFRELTQDEIEYYVTHHKPFDKAGSYGIQDWIGYIGITGIEGCYYNVMGFPVEKFYAELERFVAEGLEE
jgi:septum formation protein